MTIEEDFETVRECVLGVYGKDPLAALDRIEGYIEQCADFQRAAEEERDALKLELEAEKFNHRKDNEYLVQERDALKAENERLRKTDAWEEVARQGIEIAALEDERDALKADLDALHPFLKKVKDDRDALKAALEEIATETWNPAIGLRAKSYSELHEIARQALAKLEEK